MYLYAISWCSHYREVPFYIAKEHTDLDFCCFSHFNSSSFFHSVVGFFFFLFISFDFDKERIYGNYMGIIFGVCESEKPRVSNLYMYIT